MTAKYWFCPRCGAEPFHRSRGSPQRYSVDARCIDDFHAVRADCGPGFIEARDHPLDHGRGEFTLLGHPYRPSPRPMPESVDRRSPFKDSKS